MNLTSLKKTARASGLLLLPLLAACAASEPKPAVVQGSGPIRNDFMATTASIDRSGHCNSNPCDVYFQTPPGNSDIRIVANGFDLGTFPPGKLVSLGSYNDHVRISMPDTDYKTVFVNIPNANSR